MHLALVAGTRAAAAVAEIRCLVAAASTDAVLEEGFAQAVAAGMAAGIAAVPEGFAQAVAAGMAAGMAAGIAAVLEGFAQAVAAGMAVGIAAVLEGFAQAVAAGMAAGMAAGFAAVLEEGTAHSVAGVAGPLKAARSTAAGDIALAGQAPERQIPAAGRCRAEEHCIAAAGEECNCLFTKSANFQPPSWIEHQPTSRRHIAVSLMGHC